MNILVASSEASPFAKTGGLADVCGALPIELAKLGHDVTVMLPAYRQVHHCGQSIEATDITFEVPMGSKTVSGRLLRSHLPGTQVPVYLVGQEHYFDRAELYRENGEDYRDNCERFVFFCRAVMDCIQLLELPLDVIHCNDWQTGLIPAYLRLEYQNTHGYEQMVSLMTIHNMAYQGVFWHWDMLLTGLDWKYFNWHQMEFYGQLNLLKTGLVFADEINTVSPQYAREIQHHPHGCGLEGVLQQRRDVLTGILNGVSYAYWDPATDRNLVANYDAGSWRRGKAACKADIQQRLGLPVSQDVPLVGLIGRLAEQKGWSLVAEVMERWVQRENVQWAILGTGEPDYEDLLSRLAADYPHKVAARFEFSDELAHQIEAGADLFVMASRFEPCGLNQLYSLKYGTVPVVRATGGLADTIRDATPAHLACGDANGFCFESFDTADLEVTLQRACRMWSHQPEIWNQLVTTGMKQDWSWARSAGQYVDLYQAISARRKGLPV